MVDKTPFIGSFVKKLMLPGMLPVISLLKKNPFLFRFFRLLKKKKRAKKDCYFNWKPILENEKILWEKALRSKSNRNVLIATTMGSHIPGVTLESLIGASLTLRGVSVHVLLCDLVLPACQECDIRIFPNLKKFIKSGPQADICNYCFEPAKKHYEALGFQVHRISQYLDKDDFILSDQTVSEINLQTIRQLKIDSIAVGEHAIAGCLRFFARADLDEEPGAMEILKRYLKSAIFVARAVQKLMQKHTFESAVFHHGIYVPQGLIGEVARKNGVRVINWNPAYRKHCFIFSEGDTYHHTLMTEKTTSWEQMTWSDTHELKILDYLKSRWQGSDDWIWFHDKPQFDIKKIEKELAIDFSIPTIGLLTNVMWDAQLHYPANAFSDMIEWVMESINYFSRRKDLQLVIRVHPAEIRGAIPSRQLVVDEINKVFPVLPPNIRIIKPESQLSTYAVASKCNAVIIYGTKTGVELTSMGIPTIVAGEAWIRNKGITIDVQTAKEYFECLERLPLKVAMNRQQIERARKYAYHFFFRRMIPLEIMKPTDGYPLFKLQIESLKQILPGAAKGLDVICDGILNKNEFIYPAENL